MEEVGRDTATGTVRVRIDPRYFRPAEVEQLLGDSSKARRLLGWRHTTAWQALAEEMVRSDLERVMVDRDRLQRIE